MQDKVHDLENLESLPVVYFVSLEETFSITGLPFLQNKGFKLEDLQVHYK